MSEEGDYQAELSSLLDVIHGAIHRVDPKHDLDSNAAEFVYSYVLDTARTLRAISVLLEARQSNESISITTIRVLARHIIEGAILCAYIGKHRDEAVSSWVVTAIRKMQSSLDERPQEADDDLNEAIIVLKEKLPLKNTTEMAKDACPSLEPKWREYSFYSHPRSIGPFTLREWSVEHGTPHGDTMFFPLMGMVIEDLRKIVPHVITALNAVIPPAPGGASVALER